jgi:hypothetical protein
VLASKATFDLGKRSRFKHNPARPGRPLLEKFCGLEPIGAAALFACALPKAKTAQGVILDPVVARLENVSAGLAMIFFPSDTARASVSDAQNAEAGRKPGDPSVR